MLAPTTLTTTPTWPIAGDVPDLNAIVDDQAETIAAQEALLHAYQGVLNTAQNPVPGTAATATGTAAASPNGNQLTVSGTITGTIVIGATVADAGATTTIPAGTTIQGQISGTAGGAGVYLTNQATTAAATALKFTPPAPPAFTGWPTPQDAPTLNQIVQTQTAVIRVQTALLQHYQDLLNISQTPAPPTGP